ncbi:MAG: glycerol-3-phosphate acyltransferase PlsX [Myxococcota bacterium]|jgi:glycerol-3-phosphate acyltransferase PlsX
MGGDHAPEAIITGAVRAVRAGLSVLLVGDEARLAPLIPRGVSLPILHASEVIGMEESPVMAVRRKHDASVSVALQAVAEGRAVAAVTCGSTGAAMASALFRLGRIPGVSRPGVSAVVPRVDGGQLVLLDLGANVDCRPEHLARFALMGHCYAIAGQGLVAPRIGLLSNGHEAGKGNEQVRAAEILIRELPVNFIGQIEPTEAFRGGCDVLVCDGFVGNVMLKTVESTAEVVSRLLKEEIFRYTAGRLGAWLLQGALKRFRKRTDYAEFGGGLLLGVRGVVVVGHGRSDSGAVFGAIQLASQLASHGIVAQLEQTMASASISGG